MMDREFEPVLRFAAREGVSQVEAMRRLLALGLAAMERQVISG